MTKEEAKKILGVDSSANNEELRRAYHHKARETHPDLEGGDPVLFHQANEAYRVLFAWIKDRRCQCCDGSGYIRRSNGFFSFRESCPECREVR